MAELNILENMISEHMVETKEIGTTVLHNQGNLVVGMGISMRCNDSFLVNLPNKGKGTLDVVIENLLTVKLKDRPALVEDIIKLNTKEFRNIFTVKKGKEDSVQGSVIISKTFGKSTFPKNFTQEVFRLLVTGINFVNRLTVICATDDFKSIKDTATELGIAPATLYKMWGVNVPNNVDYIGLTKSAFRLIDGEIYTVVDNKLVSETM